MSSKGRISTDQKEWRHLRAVKKMKEKCSSYPSIKYNRDRRESLFRQKYMVCIIRKVTSNPQSSKRLTKRNSKFSS